MLEKQADCISGFFFFVQIKIKPLNFFIFCTACTREEKEITLAIKNVGNNRPPERSGMGNSGPSRMRQKAYLLLSMPEMDNNCKKKKKKRPNLLNTELV